MNCSARRFAFFLLLIVASPGIAKPAEESVMMREISFASPDEVIHSYKFPGPLKSAQVILDPGKNGVEALDVVFGNGKRLVVPASILKCFKGSRATDSFLLLLPPDQNYPTKKDAWWAAVALPFGAASGSAVPSIFPYVEFVMTNWELSGVVIQRSAEKSERISLPISECPAGNN